MSRNSFILLVVLGLTSASFGSARFVGNGAGEDTYARAPPNQAQFGFSAARDDPAISTDKAILKATEVTGKLPDMDKTDKMDCGSLPLVTESGDPVVCLAVGEKVYRVVILNPTGMLGQTQNVVRVEDIMGHPATEQETVDAVNKLFYTLDQVRGRAFFDANSFFNRADY